MKKKERPQRFDDFLGQEEIVDNLSIYIDAAKKRKEVLDHIIISGPSGMGKTTLAGIIANEMGSKITFMHGANFEKQANIISVITAVKKGDIIFIDEIHRINKVVEEILYTALEDYRIDVIVGEGLEKRTINIDIEPFCLIGATTMLGHLSIPLVNRFGIDIIFKPYTEEAVLKLVEYYANQYEVKIEKDAMKLIVIVAKNNPRQIIKLIKRIRDFKREKNSSLSLVDLQKIFTKIGYTKNGILNIEAQILQVLDSCDASIGVETLAKLVNIDRKTLENIYEPDLIRMGAIQISTKGRFITKRGKKFIKD